MILVDQDNRIRAMTDFSSVLLVEAAAGTGKTSLMAGRVAMMLASGYRPREIAAITFTELAANELNRRIRETVDVLLAGVTPAFLKPALPEGLAASQREALAAIAPELDELTNTTIHGFCQAVIHSHGIQAGLDPGARIVDAAVADSIFLNELSAWFSRRLAENALDGDPVVVLAEEIPLEVVGLVRELAFLRRKHPDAIPIQPAEGSRPDIAFVQAVDDFDRWQVSSAEDPWSRNIAIELRRLASHHADALKTKPDFASLWRLCDTSQSRLFTKDGLKLRPYIDAAESLGAYADEEANDDAMRLYGVASDAWNDLIGHIASMMVCDLSSSLDQLLDGYRRRKRAAAVLDFDDLLLHVRSLVREHDEVRRAIGRRYRYILVDEFQDTDRIQNEILFSIAASDDGPIGDWEGYQLRPGSLFLVGDPKQAIYRFRGADIAAYELSRRLISAQTCGAVIEVTANFRSQSSIVGHVNSCFAEIFGKGQQPRYVALAPTVATATYPVPCVSRFTVQVRTEGRIYAEMLRDAEAERVADICARLIGSITIPRADGSSTPLRAGDIALLSPGHTDLWRYERALEQRDLSVSSQAGHTLMRRQETQDILAMLRVLLDSSDTLAFGAFMRGPLVGLTDQELLDITNALPLIDGRPSFFNARTEASLVQHALARSILEELQHLRRRASISTPSVILAEAIERLNVRVIMAARHRNRNARALANLDALIDRARGYAVSGLRSFVGDLQADWDRKSKVPEGRIDAAEHAIEIVTIHSAKGLEWPVVIPINSTTELYRPDRFVHRQSDNSLHWMLGGVAPVDLAAARAEEDREETNQRERVWYVACTRARDLLILPHIPQAAKRSWFSSIDLRQDVCPELDLSGLVDAEPRSMHAEPNQQSDEIFAQEQIQVRDSASLVVWRRPSVHDADRLDDAPETVTSDAPGQDLEIAGAGALRGIILHKLMEEFLTTELAFDVTAVTLRAQELLSQMSPPTGARLPDMSEMAQCALRAIALPEIAGRWEWLIPEVPVWGFGEGYMLAGRADALAIKDGQVEVAIDWKSDVDPSPAARRAYASQLGDYLEATGAGEGLLVFLTSGEVVRVQNRQIELPA